MILKEYLKKEKLTGGKFAKLAGIPPATVYRILKHPDRPPRAEVLRRIAEITAGEVSLFDLVPPLRIPPVRRAAR